MKFIVTKVTVILSIAWLVTLPLACGNGIVCNVCTGNVTVSYWRFDHPRDGCDLIFVQPPHPGRIGVTSCPQISLTRHRHRPQGALSGGRAVVAGGASIASDLELARVMCHGRPSGPPSVRPSESVWRTRNNYVRARTTLMYVTRCCRTRPGL